MQEGLQRAAAGEAVDAEHLQSAMRQLLGESALALFEAGMTEEEAAENLLESIPPILQWLRVYMRP